jgi:hypothetical protein
MSENEADGLLDDLDETPSSNASEQEKRIQAFMKQVDKRVKVARARKKVSADKRIEAIRWLGESGEPTAIKTLVTLHEKDETPGVKEACAYALGQFKALEFAMEEPETAEYAQGLLQDIIFEGRFARKASPPPRTMVMVNVVLAVLFVLILGASLVLSPSESDPDEEMPTQIAAANIPTSSPDSAPAELLALYQDLDADSRTLQTQFLSITRDEAPDCSVTFNAPEAYVLPDGVSDDVQSAAITLETARAELAPIREAYTASCSAAVSIPAEQALSYSDSVVAIQRNLSSVPALLPANVTLPDNQAEATQEIIATATPEASPTPDFTPTATIDASAIDGHIGALQFDVEAMNSLRGHNTILLQYWTDVTVSGSTGGCLNLPAPILPEDYTLPAEDLAIAPPELIQAVDGFNLGMGLSRQSWQSFATACAEGTLEEVVAVQLLTAQTAQDAFDSAATQLNTLIFGEIAPATDG